MFSDVARTEIDQELVKAREARLGGFEGQARVCARRAAGAAIREYQRLIGKPASRTSAYDLLKEFGEEPILSISGRRAIQNLTLRVDEGFRLPEDIDLFVEAKRLIEELERLSIPGAMS